MTVSTNIHELPNDLIVYILTLPAVTTSLGHRLVCKRWKDLFDHFFKEMVISFKIDTKINSHNHKISTLYSLYSSEEKNLDKITLINKILFKEARNDGLSHLHSNLFICHPNELTIYYTKKSFLKEQALREGWPKIRRLLNNLAPVARLPADDAALNEIRNFLTTINQNGLFNGNPDLELIDDNLSLLPYELSQFQGLQHLNLSANEIIEIPAFIKNFYELEVFIIRSNKLSNFPSINTRNLLQLDLSNNQLTHTPKLSYNPNLTHLSLANNQLTHTPNLRCNPNLIHLDLENNQLTHTPDLSYNPSLTHLDLANNQLTYTPDLNYNPKLMVLCLENNQLTHTPNLSYNLGLTYLDLANNQLTYTPNLRYNLNLTELYLDNNQLTYIPDLSYNPELIALGLENNQLYEIPDDIFATCLDLDEVELQISGNPLVYISESICEAVPYDKAIQLFKEQLNYKCNSDFAKFCQLLMTKNTQAAREAYNQLPPEFKTLICNAFYKVCEEENELFQNFSLLRKSTKTALADYFIGMSEVDRNLMVSLFYLHNNPYRPLNQIPSNKEIKWLKARMPALADAIANWIQFSY